MRLLLDTHTLMWAVDQPSLLGAQAKVTLEDLSNSLLVSAATIWETAIKIGAKKLDLSLPYRQWMIQAINDLGAAILHVTIEYANVQAGLDPHHCDPFDRLLVAQALYEQIPIISVDPQLDAYGITRIW